MKKMIKKTSALAISAFMLAQYIPFSAVAEEGLGGNNKITIHSYLLDGSEYATAKGTGSATGHQSTDEATLATYTSKQARAGITYNIYGTDLVSGKYVPDTSAVITSVVTGDDGSVTTPNLTDGVYWIDPVDNTNTNPEFANADAFFIELPNSENPLHIYPKTTDNDYDNQSSDNGKLHTIEFTKTGVSGAALSGVVFKVYFKNAQGDWEASKDTTTGNAQTYTTNANGKITIAGLPVGDYYFVEQSLGSNSEYLLDQTPQKVTITGQQVGSTAVPVAYSFANEPKLSVSKVISTAGAGHTYNWIITADLPVNRANLSSYAIVDQFKGLTIDPESVTITDMSYGTDFTAAIGAVPDNDKLTITFTPTGLGKLNNPNASGYISANQLTVTVPSTLNSSDFNDDDNAVNMAQITYTYGYDPTGKEPVIPDAPTPPVPITEPSPLPDPDNVDPESPTNEDPDDPFEAVKPCTFYISNQKSDTTELTGGRYDVSSGSEYNDTDNAYTGNLTVVNNLAPGPYTIKQLGTASGYQVDTTIKNIYIGKDGNIYEYNPTAAEGSKIGAQILKNTVIFTNAAAQSNFNLPFTGTTATIVFSITGILLMAGTAFFIFIILKKRDDDEEEQENN